MEALKLSKDGFYLLLFLFPGYIAFRVYFIDKPWNSLNAVHISFGSLAFSTITYLIYGIILQILHIGEHNISPFLFSLITTPLAIIIGLFWRLVGHRYFHWALIKLGVTNEDNNATPWMQLFNNPNIRLSQITVYLKDGSALRCDDTKYFDTPDLRRSGVYAYYSSSDGEICFVANQIKTKDTKIKSGISDPVLPSDLPSEYIWEEVQDIHIEAPWGVKLQWVPAREIVRVEVRANPLPLPKNRTIKDSLWLPLSGLWSRLRSWRC